MVTGNESRQLSAWKPVLDDKALLQLEQKYSLPYSTPSIHTANLAVPGQTTSDFHGLNIGQPDAVFGLCKLVPPHNDISCPFGSYDAPFGCASRKRFLIFDHSENQTKLFVCPTLCPQNDEHKEVASEVDEQLVVEERWDENDLSGGEDEMVEDSEEIDALLYSDSDDEDEDDDEVTSTMRTLFSIDNEQVVENYDSSPKRQKLVDGSYKKSSLVNADVDDDVESREDDDSKKVKIHDALKILGDLVPDLKSKDPLCVIEKAILYLEAMKTEAQSLGLSASS